jgi:phosphate/sulfate permease
MVSLTFVGLVVVALVTCLAMAWTLGANSNSPPFAPAIGANAIPTMRAAFLIGLLAGAGAITQGGSISETVGSALILDTTITPLAAIAGLLTASAYLAFGIYTGYPVPAAFAVTGAMVGVGLSKGGTPAFATYREIVTFWALVPVVSGGLAFSTATLLRRDDVDETTSIPLLAALVGGVLAHIRLGVIPAAPGEAQSSVAAFVSRTVGGAPELAAGVDLVELVVTVAFAALAAWWIRRRTEQSVQKGIRTFLVALGSVVAFSSGGSQVGLATGPLETLFRQELGLPGAILLALGGAGILAGAWMGSPRLLKATAQEYAQLGVRRSIAALVPGFLIVQAAITLGIPISFNNIIISGVIGSGLAAGAMGVSRRKIGVTVVFWLSTLVTSILVGFGVYRVLSGVLGFQ